MRRRSIRFYECLMPLGIISATLYGIYALLEWLLWGHYSASSSAVIISIAEFSLSRSDLLRMLMSLAGGCGILFTFGMIIRARKKYHLLVRKGYLLLALAEAVYAVSGALWPHEYAEGVISVRSIPQVISWILFASLAISSAFVLSRGYLRQEYMRRTGSIMLAMGIVLSLAAAFVPVNIVFQWNILGVGERVLIYAFQACVFALSFAHVFILKERL